ncbi:NUDIX domain-containing protein [Microvirga flavescens]|uniref:NUDIX domain-containing protein n=1 Tax=Microvirga flavescens TaxID=2249811 RepID=UPI000DD6C045|nr:NUDIX domain-containing protein [Microvirga flavescens]
MPASRLLRFIPETLLRRVLHTFWRFSRGLTVGVRAVAIDPEGRVCLIRHTYIAGWHLPGGGVEAGETVIAALERELREEAGIVATGDFELHGIFYNERVSRRDHVLVYVVRHFTSPGEKKPDKEIAEMGFFAPDALPEGTSAATRRRLAEIFAGQPRILTW